MSSFQYKFARHTKRQERTQSEEGNYHQKQIQMFKMLGNHQMENFK